MALYRDFSGNRIEKKILDKFTLIFPGEYSSNEIINKLNHILPYRVSFWGGFENSYKLKVDVGATFHLLHIDHYSKDKETIISITDSVNGKELERGGETFERETFMELICEKIDGLLWIERYETIDYCEKTSTKYCINYKEDTVEYELISILIDNSSDPLEIIKMTNIIKSNKEAFFKCLEI